MTRYQGTPGCRGVLRRLLFRSPPGPVVELGCAVWVLCLAGLSLATMALIALGRLIHRG